jgi:hypothetical protein
MDAVISGLFGIDCRSLLSLDMSWPDHAYCLVDCFKTIADKFTFIY